MAKYIIDLDAFTKCLDLLVIGTLNDKPYVYMDRLKYYISNFPKHKVEENVKIKIKSDIQVLDWGEDDD